MFSEQNETYLWTYNYNIENSNKNDDYNNNADNKVLKHFTFCSKNSNHSQTNLL